jgi:NTP pyrophosphatase (non-canonical NTP hydrolase)
MSPEQEAWEWNVTVFGRDVAHSEVERGLRTLEEAIELAQASGVTAEQASHLMRHVYSKELGDVATEISDVLLCLLIQARMRNLDVWANLEALQARLWKPEAIAKIHEKYEGKCRKGLTAFPDWVANRP